MQQVTVLQSLVAQEWTMRRFARTALIGLLLLGVQSAQAEQQPYPKTEEALLQAFENLNWQTEPRTYSLGESHILYQHSEEYLLLLEKDARRFMFLNNGVEFPETDAVVYDPISTNQFVFSFFEEGYVNDEDWNSLDKDLLIEGIIESTEEANIQRIENRISPIEILGWSQEPTYDKSSRTAYWAIKA